MAFRNNNNNNNTSFNRNTSGFKLKFDATNKELNVVKPNDVHFGDRNENITNKYRAVTVKTDSTDSTSENNRGNKLKEKKNDGTTYRIFTGTAERIIKWNKVYENFCYYEVISSVISIQEGSIRLQKIMLLKDKKGPILQVVHYINDHINIEDFHVGQMLRCVGRMVGPNTLHAVSIRAATNDEIANLLRLCYICDHAIARTV